MSLVFSKTTSIVGGVTYEFKIVATNVIGDSVASISLPILAAQVPSAPQSLVKYFADKTSITVSWAIPANDGSSAIIGYNVYFDNGSGTISSTAIGSTTWQTLTFSKTALTTNTNYLFAVSAYNAVGDGPQATSIPILTATVPGQPQTPALVSSSKSSLQISWSDPVDLGGTTLQSYVVQMDQGSSVGPGVFRVVNIQPNVESDTYYTATYLNSGGVATNLLPGDIYQFKITARNIVGDSVVSNVLYVMAASLPGITGPPTR
jgi:hypothetical protein